MSTLLGRLLTLRFGNVSLESIEKIHKLDSEKLLKLSDALLGFKDLADLTEWLGEHDA